MSEYPTPPVSLVPSLSLSASSTYVEPLDVFSASFIYADFNQRGVLLATCRAKLSLKITDEFIYPSLAHSSPFLATFSPPWDDSCGRCLQSLTNGSEIS